MSGGRWNYQQLRIEEKAEEIRALLDAVAKTEHIVDWSESDDTGRDTAEPELYDLWVATFDKIYGRG